MNLFGLAAKKIDSRTSCLKNCFCGTFLFINVRAKSGLNDLKAPILACETNNVLSGQKKFENEELQTLPDENYCQTQEDIPKYLGVSQAHTFKSKKIEIKPRGVERRLLMSEILLISYKNKSCSHPIVTSDEKWIHYNNLKRKKIKCETCLVVQIHGKAYSASCSKVYLCIWLIRRACSIMSF